MFAKWSGLALLPALILATASAHAQNSAGAALGGPAQAKVAAPPAAASVKAGGGGGPSDAAAATAAPSPADPTAGIEAAYAKARTVIDNGGSVREVATSLLAEPPFSVTFARAGAAPPDPASARWVLMRGQANILLTRDTAGGGALIFLGSPIPNYAPPGGLAALPDATPLMQMLAQPDGPRPGSAAFDAALAAVGGK